MTGSRKSSVNRAVTADMPFFSVFPSGAVKYASRYFCSVVWSTPWVCRTAATISGETPFGPAETM